MRDWLATQGWGDVFLDLDPSAGLAPGQRWRDELRKAGERCSAIVVLISPHWAESHWCLSEFNLAAHLGKEIFPVLIAPCPLSKLPVELTADYQLADISTPQKRAEGFERLRIGIQRAGLHPGAFSWPPRDEPKRPIFRGLRVLEEKDAAIFFGRDVQITKALDKIRQLRDGVPARMLAILGASGAGKSSFLRAGLLARLKRDTERFLVLPTVRPGRAALTGPTGLQSALGLTSRLDGAKIAARFAELREPVIERLRKHSPNRIAGPAPMPPTVVLPIDQAEELFVAGDEEAAAAVALIVDVVQAEPGLLLLVTIRSDSFDLLQGDPLLSGISREPFDLPRLPGAAFKEIIEGPPRLPGVGIEFDADLTELLIRDFGGADALPLLAFTLERLITEHGADGRIETREYVDEMKGVGGAIRKAVEAAFVKAAEIPGLPRSRAELDAMAQRTFVPGLVRIDDAAAVAKRRVALRRQLPQEAIPLVDCLVNERLLVSDTAGTEPTVEVSHEAVLRHWRELEGWIMERRADLALAERVIAAAREWRAVGGSAGQEALVHRGERLRAAEKLLLWDELRRLMSDDSIAYLAACRDAETRAQVAAAAQAQRQRRLRRWIVRLVAAAAIVTALGAALVVMGQRNLARAQSLTLTRAADRIAEGGDHVRALRLSILASRDNLLMPATAESIAALSSAAQALRLSIEYRGHNDRMWGASFSKDGRRILTWSVDGTARLWDTATGAQIGPALKHSGAVHGAVFSKEEARILTWSFDRTVRLWDVATGAQIGPALQHGGRVVGAVFSKDEARILTWSDDIHDNTVRLWDAATGAQISPALNHGGVVEGAVFSSDERRILTWGGGTVLADGTLTTEGTVRLRDTATAAQIGQTLKHKSGVDGAVFSKDERRILTWSFDTARLWDAATGRQIGPVSKHENGVRGAVFSPDERHILTWSDDATARLWNPATGTQVERVLSHGGRVRGAVFGKDGRCVLTWSDDATVRKWDTATGAQIGEPLRHEGPVTGAVFSKNEDLILTWSLDTAWLWDVATNRQMGTVLKHDDAVGGAVFSPDERHILTWSNDATARLWNPASGTQVEPVLSHDGISGAVFSKDERRILTWGDDHTVRLWDAATGGQIDPAFKHDKAVNGAVFSHDERRVLTWSDDATARLWDTATGEQVQPVLKHDGPVKRAVLSADGHRILSWSDDFIAQLFDVASGHRIRPALEHEDAVTGAVFSRNGQRILTWSKDATARLWDAAKGTQIGPTFKHNSPVNGAVFLNDERRILTWSDDATARLWDTVTGKQLEPVLKHDSPVIRAVFSPGERRILTASADITHRLWDTTTMAQTGLLRRPTKNTDGAVFSEDGSRILTWSNDFIAQLFDAASGDQLGPALTHDSTRVVGAIFSKHGRRILTWGDDGTARLWDAATGAQIGSALKQGGPVLGAVFSKDERRILTWSYYHNRARLWDVKWAMRNTTDSDFVRDICRDKLVGASIEANIRGSARPVLVGLRHIDVRDTEAAPILRGREGQNVCAPAATAWETVKSLVRSSNR